ncbi:MAG: dihydroorotate dehydrogenase electron transfer subunit [Defluviitaleaceae bacterium]|nr:dihydroorotate dehydrogenase electron transfer subunit [Defluviitaleaceae bacterium]
MKVFTNAKVVENINIHTDIYKITLSVPFAKNVFPGQFIMICLKNGVNLLPRPLSICSATESTITIIYEIVGAGTKEISMAKPEDSFKILGPLGNTFEIPTENKNIALIGGGIGTPPIYFFAKKLYELSIPFDVYLGFRNKSILFDEFKQLTKNVYLATDTGIEGTKGNIIDLLKNENKTYDYIFACGPKPMFKALATYKDENTKLYLSLEEHMACGVGTCVGCVVKNKDNIYEKICVNGPIFESNYINF